MIFTHKRELLLGELARAMSWISLRAVLLGAVIFALPNTITLFEKHEGEEGLEAQVHVQAVMTELRIQDGLALRITSAKPPMQRARQEPAFRAWTSVSTSARP